MKQKILITSLAKVKKNTPWRVGIYLNDNYTFFNVGEKGNVAMSPRFHMFLSEVEQKVSRYPVDISFHSIEKNREMEVTTIRDQIVYVDCGFTSNRLIPNARFYYDKHVLSNPLEVRKQAVQQPGENTFSMFEEKESLASTTLDYVAIGKVEEVTDGDTIKVSLKYLSSFLDNHFSIDEEIDIRFNGVDTPEKRQEGAEGYKDPKNAQFGKTYGVTMDDMYEVGDEAAKFTKELLGWKESDKPLVIIHFDRNKDGDDPLMDSGYGRYVADLYSTSDKTADIVMEKVKKGNSFVHIPKTLLTTYSTKFPHIPLGLFNFQYANGTTILNPFDWVHELDLDTFDPGNQITPSDEVEDDGSPDIDASEPYESEINTDTINFSSQVGPSKNTLDFFEPYDDRLSVFTSGIKTVEDLKVHSKVRIGDVILTIPPISIDVNKTASISKVKTLRTKSSVLVNRGQSVTTLSMDLYFHDLDSINGKKCAWKKEYGKNEEKKYFYVDGLRPLLAQFAKAPFLPIDNYYINDVFGIQDVALTDIEVTTVPNFPESLTARITLAEFNSEAYFMDRSTLGEAVNYPMLRWYYNQSLKDRGEKYRFFKALEAPITSDISFTLASEEYLSMRKQAIEYMKTADSPEKIRVEMKNKNISYANKKSDAKKVKKVIEQYEAYKASGIKEYSLIDDIPPVSVNSAANELVDKYGIKKETAENAVNAGVELFTTLYNGKYSGEKLVHQKNIFIPYESRAYYDMRFDLNIFFDSAMYQRKEVPPISYSDELYKDKEKSGLVILEKMEDIDNQAILEKSLKKYYDKARELYIFPGTSALIDSLSEIKKSAKNMLATVDEYEDEFNSMMRVLEASEKGVPMNDYEIPGELIPISINARYSNEFSMVHVQSGEAPTLQYMGGGDPGLDLILEVDEDGARAFNKLISTSDYYAKTYNQGITNGYIGVKNDLAELLGIRYIMFENISVQTSPGYPGRYQLMLKCIGFDKTQRQREELTALPGNSQHMDVELLENNKNAFASDRLIESRLHKLEVYPDMELPTYDQINGVLKEMDAGKCEEYVNLTGGTYLDPDFYFSTVSTLRQEIENTYSGRHQLNMFDSTGVAVMTSSGSTDKLFDTTEDDWKKLQDMQDTDGVEQISWVFKWTKEQEDNGEGQNTSAGPALSQSGGQVSVKNSEVMEFLNAETDGVKNYTKFPSKTVWEGLFGKEYSFDDFSKKPSPSEYQIYNELSSLVDKYFKKYYSFPDFIKECRGNLKDADESKKKVSYSSPEDFYSVMYRYKVNHVEFGEAVKIDELDRKGIIPVPPKSKNVLEVHFRQTDLKPTKERFMTLFKAFLDKTSQWKHYKGKEPMISSLGRVGVAQVDITTEDMSVREVMKLMYNWKYNLQESFKQLAKHYEEAKKLDKDCKNFETYVRPWDTMFALYENPKAKTAKDLNDSDIAYGVLNRFNHYATKPFNTFSGFNDDVYKKHAGLSKEEKATIGSGEKKQYIKTLLDLEYYDKAILKKADLKVDSEKDNIKKVMEKYLEKLSEEEVYDIYQKHLKKLYEMAGKDWFGGEKDTNGYKYSSDILAKAEDLYQSIKDIEDTATSSTEATDTRLYNDVDPRVLYQEMFYDLRYHDQRGRMLRAFPGFQMFIIHEGDYFGKYKFWDNMYGFNAIESIDVHRSRKVAADTAVISMTNVYSNLSTRRTDIDYVDRQMKWWDNYIWNDIPQDLVDKKENEIHKNIFLETGARIHLRMGYGATASALPVVFNGTITELEIGDVIDIVAQGDGIELGNVISGDPDDDNDGLFSVTEPRDLICSLMSSKGSWFKDFMSRVSDGRLFRKNPLGIMHFGQPFDTNDSSASKPLGNLLWWNDEYGEVAQNIYSSNGTPTFSQWLHPNGERNNIFEDFSLSRLWENKFKIFNPGDEKNVVVKFYNNTVWDVIQTITYTSPDYIAAVHPFELRSTLFFGKPYWRAAFQYDSRYEYDAANKTWARHLTAEARRPYMQNKFYTSGYDIIQNNIRASEDNVFTNVIVNYDGKQTPVIYADADIRYDKQKTRVVEADIVAKFADFYTSEVMATYFGCSALRDSLKDMYQGNLLVLGDPTAKPHDMMYVYDDINDLNGNALIKSVTHHFSLDTGFITSIEPDLLVVNDDQMILEMSKWYYSFGQSLAATVALRFAANKASKNLAKWLLKPNGLPSSVGKWVSTKGLRSTVSMINDGSQEMQAIMKTLDDIIAGKGDVNVLRTTLASQFADATANLQPSTGKAAIFKDTTKKAVLKSGASFAKLLTKTDDIAKVGKGIINTVKGVASLTPIGAVINAAIFIGTEMLFEHYRRYKENLQSVVAIPLTYRGKELTAGINNHAGMIYGDAPGRYDKLFDATMFSDDGETEEIFGNSIIEITNFVTGSGGSYADAEKTKQLNQLGNN